MHNKYAAKRQSYRGKTKLICRDKPIFRPVPPAVEGKTAALSVNMSVAAEADLMFFQKFKYLAAAISLKNRRIMEEYQLFSVPRRVQGCLKAHYLPAHYFFIVLAALFFFKEPTPGTADGIFSARAVFIKIIVRISMLSIPFSRKKRPILAAVFHQ